MVTSRKVGKPGYWIPYRNPFDTDDELNVLVKMDKPAANWKSKGVMPHWVEYLLEFADKPKTEGKGIAGTIAEVNKYLEQHPDVEAMLSNTKRKIGLVKRIA